VHIEIIQIQEQHAFMNGTELRGHSKNKSTD